MREPVDEIAPSAVVPPSHRSAATRLAWKALWVAPVALLVYYALFRLPFLFPPRQRLWSASYAFGFNNGVAILALAALLALVALFYLVRRRSGEQEIDFAVEQSASDRRSMMIALSAVALAYLGLTVALYLYNARTASWLMWETRHLLHRARLMELYGLQPYTEFHAEYGPLLTTTPVYLHWLLKPLGVSLPQAYFAAHLLLNFAGVWCIYYVLSHAKMPASSRVVAFLILAVAGFAPYMGLNGVLLRYLAPFSGVVLGHRWFVGTLSGKEIGRWWLSAIFIICLLLALNVLLSPEAAVAFVISWLGYGVLMIRRDPRLLLASLVAYVIAGLLCWLLLPAGYYGSLLRFSEGANNLPLLPVPHLLLYILTLFLVVPPLLARSVRHDVDVPGAALCGALGMLCVIMAPGALGRCDPPHVLFFGLGASMLLMIQLANRSHRAFASYVVAYAAVFIVLMQVVNLQVFFGVNPRELFSVHAVSHLARHLRSGNGTERPSQSALAALDHYPRLGLPYASFGDPAVENYVVSRGQLQPEYYVAVVGIYTAEALQRKLRDIGRMEYLLLPRKLEAGKPHDPCAEYRKSIRQWFLYRPNWPCRASPLDPGGAVDTFIAAQYLPVEQVGSWVVLRRKPDSVPGEPPP